MNKERHSRCPVVSQSEMHRLLQQLNSAGTAQPAVGNSIYEAWMEEERTQLLGNNNAAGSNDAGGGEGGMRRKWDSSRLASSLLVLHRGHSVNVRLSLQLRTHHL